MADDETTGAARVMSDLNVESAELDRLETAAKRFQGAWTDNNLPWRLLTGENYAVFEACQPYPVGAWGDAKPADLEAAHLLLTSAARLIAALRTHTPAHLPQAEAQGPARAATAGLRKAAEKLQRGLERPGTFRIDHESALRTVLAGLSTGPSASGGAGLRKRVAEALDTIDRHRGMAYEDKLTLVVRSLSPTPATEPETHAADAAVSDAAGEALAQDHIGRPEPVVMDEVRQVLGSWGRDAVTPLADDVLDATNWLLRARPTPHAPATGASSGLTAEEEAIFGDERRNGGLVRDLCFTVWRLCHEPAHKDGNTDWSSDTLPTVDAGIEKLRGMVAQLVAAARRSPVDGDGGAKLTAGVQVEHGLFGARGVITDVELGAHVEWSDESKAFVRISALVPAAARQADTPEPTHGQ